MVPTPSDDNLSSSRFQRRGLRLDRVVLLGRTLQEYSRCFGLDLDVWRGKKVLDVASGVSSFAAEASAAGLEVTAVDPIYSRSREQIAAECIPDLERVCGEIGHLDTYRWTPNGYVDVPTMRQFRERAYQTFLEDYSAAPRDRYIAAALPHLPFAAGRFDLVLVSYFLFVYEDQFDLPFHRAAIRELLRVGREIRIYPLVTLEAQPSKWLEDLRHDPEFRSVRWEVVPTNFEFLLGSNKYLRLTPAAC
jgi:ubiquinone/menaquinone biosynthesis C-methylase UbiE